jgi:carbonic anhydrase/acetyltransferase-like protein (isoleucine patch superfamily)
MIKAFNGKTPKIHPSAFVSEAAYVIGDVEIGENSGVWPGAVIRGDFAKIRIGSNTMVEDNCVLHTGSPMEIGNNVIIGHGVVVHGKKIGHDNLIGNNATLLDDSETGNFCIVAAGCLVSQGMKLPDNTMAVGVPARIKRENPPDFKKYLREGLKTYSVLLKQYKQQEL